MVDGAQKRRFLVSPYMFILTTLFGLLMVGAHIAIGCMIVPIIMKMSLGVLFNSGWLLVIVLLVVIFLSFLIAYYLHSYEYFGVLIIQNTSIILLAPLRKTIEIKYSEIRDLGIDYSVLSNTKQFWIFLSKENISSKYLHQIARCPISSNCIRIQYSKRVYNALLEVLPCDFKKSLCRCSSVVRLHRLEE